MYSNISKWSAWDLHIHTRASNKKKENDYGGDGTSFTDNEIENFTSKIFFPNGPTMIAITDHDYFDHIQFAKIKKECLKKSQIENRDLNVLPGVELDVKFKLNKEGHYIDSWSTTSEYKDSQTCHCIIIFNDDNKEDVFYEKINNIIELKYPDASPAYLDEIFMEFVKNRIEFISIPHFTKHKGIERALKDDKNDEERINENKKANWIISGYFPLLDAREDDFVSDKTQKIYNLIKEHRNGLIYPLIRTTDNHNYHNYEEKFKTSYYKALPTFKGLRMCISDYEQRISNDLTINDNTYIKYAKIISIQDNLTPEITIELSSGLNCVIGGRSSGKSFLLKKIYDAATNDSKNKEELKKYTKYNEKIKVELFDSFGRKYIGKPSYYSQGSIIDIYSKNSEKSLFDEFREYFPFVINETKFQNDKNALLRLLIDYNDSLIKISNLSNEIKQMRCSDYFRIPLDGFSNVISNKKMCSEIDKVITIVENLNMFTKNLYENLNLIDSFSNLITETKKLINESENTLNKSKVKLNNYLKIRDISNRSIVEIVKTTDDNKLNQQNQIKALASFTNKVLDFINAYEMSFKIIDKVRKVIDSLNKTDKYENIIDKYKFTVKVTNDLTITSLLDGFKSYLKNDYASVIYFSQLTNKVFNIGYKNNISKNLQSILNDVISKAYKVDYLIYEQNELINEMSEGRKVGVFLALLLSKDNVIEPLIIDQPEDDMDNMDIYDILVKALRETKSKRQIILATHDANIVVNGDSENIIFAKRGRRNKLEYEFGALEYEDSKFNAKKVVCDVLEGGERAFAVRTEKYDINKYELYKWR